MRLEERVFDRAVETGLRELRGHEEPPDLRRAIRAELLAQQVANQPTVHPPDPSQGARRGFAVQRVVLAGGLLVLVAVAGLTHRSGGEEVHDGTSGTTAQDKEKPGDDGAKPRRVKLRVFRSTDAHVALHDIARETRANLVVSPAVRGTVTMEIQDKTAQDAASTLATSIGMSCRVGGNGLLVVQPEQKPEDGIQVQFPSNSQEITLQSFARIIANSAHAPVVIRKELRGKIRVRDARGRAIWFRAPTWTGVVELALEPTGLTVVERTEGALVIVSAQDDDPKAHVAMSMVRAELRKVVAVIEKRAGRPIRIDPRCKGAVTVQLRGVPWRRALAAVAAAVGAKVLEPSRLGAGTAADGPEIRLVPLQPAHAK